LTIIYRFHHNIIFDYPNQITYLRRRFLVPFSQERFMVRRGLSIALLWRRHPSRRCLADPRGVKKELPLTQVASRALLQEAQKELNQGNS
jgi:hypothetical protein